MEINPDKPTITIDDGTLIRVTSRQSLLTMEEAAQGSDISAPVSATKVSASWVKSSAALENALSSSGRKSDDENDGTDDKASHSRLPMESNADHQASYHDHGRHHFASENLAFSEQDDPFKYTFEFIDVLQEYAVPLLLGVIIAMVMANVVPKTYEYYFAGCKPPGVESDQDHRRRLSGGGEPTCAEDRFLLSECGIFGHAWTLHFISNDIVMIFHFALAMKEVTESLLPGGSLNPPSKAMNPILVTIGCVAGPIIAYFVLLKSFISMGFFDDEIERGLSWADLSNGWGVVAATDIILAWLVGRLVFGDGHPAIDFLLLLAVASDGIGMVFIAIFYTDPLHPVQPKYLSIVGAGMGIAYALRKW